VTNAPPDTQISVLQRGHTTLVGLIFPEDTEGGARVSWKTPSHLYDVRAGKYLGETAEISIPAAEKPQPVHLFSLHTSPVAEVDLQTAGQGTRGETLALQVGVRFRDETLTPSNRLLRIDATDPAGNEMMHYRKFVSQIGSVGESEIPFAYNDPAGEWTLAATDVATGVSAILTVMLID
jgi:hypothetical protein